MKLILLLILSFTSITAFTQIDNNDVIKRQLEELRNKKAKQLTLPKQFFLNPGTTLETLSATPIKPGVYTLPQDGMPCVVPDREGIAAIPNVSKVITLPFRSQMPNAYQRKEKPTELTK